MIRVRSRCPPPPKFSDFIPSPPPPLPKESSHVQPLTNQPYIPTEDERSIANRLEAAHDQNDPSDGSGKKKTVEQLAGEIDPTLPARMHGNEPSRGAKIDKSIEDEEAEILRRMDESKAAKKANN